MSLAVMLAACGGGGGVSCPAGVDCSGGGTTPPPPPPPAASCADVTGALTSNVKFSSTDVASNTVVSTTGQTACFTTNTPSGVRSTTAIQPGSYYYFEATRTANTSVAVGVASATMSLVPNTPGNTDIYTTDQALILRDSSAETMRLSPPANDSTGATTFPTSPFNVGQTETTFGFAVDYRGTYPVIYVLGSTDAAQTDSIAPSQCAGTGVTRSATTPCVYGVEQMPGVTGPLYIYAFGSTFAGGTPKASINGGADLNARPFKYAPLDVRNAVRKRWMYGERQLNTQWAQTSPTALPTITATSRNVAVVKTDDTAPYTGSFSVTATAGAGGALTGTAVQWLTETGALISTGLTLDLTATNTKNTVSVNGTSYNVGHRIQAVVTDPTSKQISGVDFVLTYTATDSDDDGDGLTYSQEKTYVTDPANADTDADGLGDGIEVALGGTGAGYNPNAFSTTGSANVSDGQRLAGDSTLPVAVRLARQTADSAGGSGSGFATAQGVVLMDDKLTIALTSQLNPDCLLNRGVYAGTSPPLTVEECKKRAIRADAGIKSGEFRYYETHRLVSNPGGLNGLNMGQGFVTSVGKIDPFCCVAAGGARDPRTPFSFMVNNATSIWDTLVSIAPYDAQNTTYVGFAVDYRSSPPVAYAITTDPTVTSPVAGIAIYGPRPISGFTGNAIPFVYGHPTFDAAPAMDVNFGLKPFHYTPTQVLALINSVSAGQGAALVPGVGIHRQP